MALSRRSQTISIGVGMAAFWLVSFIDVVRVHGKAQATGGYILARGMGRDRTIGRVSFFFPWLSVISMDGDTLCTGGVMQHLCLLPHRVTFCSSSAFSFASSSEGNTFRLGAWTFARPRQACSSQAIRAQLGEASPKVRDDSPP